MNIEKELADVVNRFIDKNPNKALSALTEHFVGLTVALVEANGGGSAGEITIDGGDSRDITIHARKP